MSWLLALLLVLLGAGSAQALTSTHFATQNGLTSGTCTTSGTACRLDYILPRLVAGNVLGLIDGTYTGDLNMMNAGRVASNNGTSGSPITVQAINDGQVTFDGQATNFPCYTYALTYWTFTGFNCARGGSAKSVLRIQNSNNITVQRVCAWEALIGAGQNNQVGIIWNSNNTLIEDSCFFGTANETFMDYSDDGVNGHNNILRRVWLRAEGDTSPQNGVAVQYNYTQASWTNAVLSENVIAIAGPYRGVTGGMLASSNPVRHSAVSPYQRFYGSIDYVYAGTSLPLVVYTDGSNTPSGLAMADNLIHHNGSNAQPFRLNACNTDLPCQVNTSNRLTAIKGTTGSGTAGMTSITNFVEATTVAGTQFDYTGTNGTARLCFQYNGGTISSTKLWPWPMDDRIKAAIAASPSAAFPLTGSAGTGYNPATVTSEIVSLFGAIPQACNSASQSGAAAPSNLRFTP